VNRHYELVLMLDPEAADDAREKVAGDVRQAIEGTGTLDQADVWGVRKLAYEIRQRNEADYRYYRFQGEPDLLEQLDHSLKITDGVLRFRIFKIDPDSQSAPHLRSPGIGRRRTAGSRRPAAPRTPRRPRLAIPAPGLAVSGLSP
jgi:small subunit ribosomal protein S6